MAAWTLAAAVMAGCAPLGPNYTPPAAPRVGRYTESPLPARTESTHAAAGASQHYATGGAIPADWWDLFRSKALGRLVREAIAASPTLDAARAALVQAQENLKVEYAVLFPGIDVTAGERRQRSSGASAGLPNLPPNLFTLYNASVNVSYAFDITGAARRELEALRSQIDYQKMQLQAAYLSLTANVVTASFKEASLRGQIAATREVIKAQAQVLGVVEKQLALGAVAGAEVLAQRAQLGQLRANLPPLEKALAQTRNALAALTGRFPADARLPESDLAKMHLPKALPVSLPSALVRQRPDIRAAEALLHAASAKIGVAEAAKYPQLSITASYGTPATQTGILFSSEATFWNFAANLTQPLFHAGKLEAQQRVAVAAYDQALAQYRQTVLAAFRDVADVLEALQNDAGALKAQAEAEAAARASFELARRQFRLGATSYLALLDAERQFYQAKIALVQAQTARFTDTAALYQAVGGGWWHRGAGIEEGDARQ